MTELVPIRSEDISPKEYLDLVKKDERNIKNAEFIPPTLGDGGFGSFHVEYKDPVLKPKAWSSF